MTFKTLIMTLLMAVFVLPVLGQDAPTINTVSFNNVSFGFDSSLASQVNISWVDAVSAEGPVVAESAHTEFALKNQNLDDAMSEGGVLEPMSIRIYRTADLPGLEFVEDDYQQLQTLLTDRPDLATLTAVSETGDDPELPYLPVQNAGQAFRARAHYIDTANVQGVSYVTIYRQDVSGFRSNELIYTFQGLSLDGVYYVSAVFHVSTDVFPAQDSTDFDGDTYVPYLVDSVNMLNTADDTSFTPSLLTLDAVIQSLAFGPVISPTAAAPTVAAPVVTVAATDVSQDPSLGGLSGTWTLVSYGPAEAQQPALPAAPITLTFAESGIGGSSGCNTYGGGFQYNGNALSFNNVVSTLMACADDINAQEAAYLTALSTVSAYQIAGNQLIITYEGGVLTFTNGLPVPTPTVTLAVTATPTIDPAVPTLDPALPTATATP